MNTQINREIRGAASCGYIKSIARFDTVSIFNLDELFLIVSHQLWCVDNKVKLESFKSPKLVSLMGPAGLEVWRLYQCVSATLTLF